MSKDKSAVISEIVAMLLEGNETAAKLLFVKSSGTDFHISFRNSRKDDCNYIQSDANGI